MEKTGDQINQAWQNKYNPENPKYSHDTAFKTKPLFWFRTAEKSLR
jgi:hypothetical protein